MIRLWLLTILLAFGFVSRAGDQALLIGTWNYPGELALPGVRVDMTLMREVCDWLQYESIRTLNNPSVNEMEEALKKLARTVNRQDRVLIYFGGHGDHINDVSGDEHDGVDEVLCTKDYAIDRQGRISGVMTDDRFGELLEQIPSDRLTIILDTCFGGSATRGFGDSTEDYDVKFIGHRGRPASYRYGNRKPPQTTRFSPKGLDFDRYIVLAAAMDNERALSRSNGSLFTIGLHQVLDQARRNQQNLDFASLCERVTRNIWSRTKRTHRAVLSGDPKRYSERVFINNFDHQYTDRHSITAKANYRLKVETNRPKLRVNDRLFITISRIPIDGYVNVLGIDGNGVISLLFPNDFRRESWLEATGEIVMPSRDYFPFELVTREATGKERILVIHTREPLNLLPDSDNNDQLAPGRLEEIRRHLLRTAADTRGPGYGAGEVTVHTLPER